MKIQIASDTTGKTEWTAPELVELDLDMTKVENGLNAGNDGSGGNNTSLS